MSLREGRQLRRWPAYGPGSGSSFRPPPRLELARPGAGEVGDERIEPGAGADDVDQDRGVRTEVRQRVVDLLLAAAQERQRGVELLERVPDLRPVVGGQTAQLDGHLLRVDQQGVDGRASRDQLL